MNPDIDPEWREDALVCVREALESGEAIPNSAVRVLLEAHETLERVERERDSALILEKTYVQQLTELRAVIENQGFQIEHQKSINKVLIDRVNFLRNDVRALEDLLDEARKERDDIRRGRNEENKRAEELANALSELITTVGRVSVPIPAAEQLSRALNTATTVLVQKGMRIEG